MIYIEVLTLKQHIIKGSILIENGANITFNRGQLERCFTEKLPRVNHMVIEGKYLVEKVLL